MQHFELLRERTGNNPHHIKKALSRDAQLATSIRELDTIHYLIGQHERNSKRRFIVQAHPKFYGAFSDFKARWSHSRSDLMDWEAEQAGQEPFSLQLDKMLAELQEQEPAAQSQLGIDDEWDFDPDEHSAALLIESVADYIADRADDEPFFSRAAGAFKWLLDSVGLDVALMEQRWKEFGLFVVPQHVSDLHGLDDPLSLYGHLTQARLAYMGGADMAAMAMCRAATEILMRRHYNDDNETKLTRLIAQTQQQRQFAFLKQYNLISKVGEANRLLHSNLEHIENIDRQRTVIRDWVRALQEIIDRAPPRRQSASA